MNVVFGYFLGFSDFSTLLIYESGPKLNDYVNEKQEINHQGQK